MRSELAELYAEGARAAEELLRGVCRVDVAKALDPLDPKDFLAIVQRLSNTLRGATKRAEADALRRAIAKLDVDWPELSSEARNQVVAASRKALRSVADQVLPAVDRTFAAEATSLVRGTKQAAIERFDLGIEADLTRTDERIARFARASQGNFVRDEYGRRADAFSAKAREIVASGLERGLGRDDISEELSTTLSAQGLNRSKAYWDMISMTFANRARTNTELAAFEEAGVSTYRYEAVMDAATSAICRFLNGREASVSKAMDRFHEVEKARDPEAIREIQPWVQVGADEDGNQVLYYERGGRRHAVARIEDPASEDSDPSFSAALTDEQLEAAGLVVPPAHGHCRSTLTAQ